MVQRGHDLCCGIGPLCICFVQSFFFRDRAVSLAIELENSVLMIYVYREQWSIILLLITCVYFLCSAAACSRVRYLCIRAVEA